MTWVKICGITNLEDALTAVDAGADALGFVFYDKSSRYVDPQTAQEIVAKLPVGVEKVGVFVGGYTENLVQLISRVGLTATQLHFGPHIDFVSNTTAYGAGRFPPGFRSYLSLPAAAFTENVETSKRFVSSIAAVAESMRSHSGGDRIANHFQTIFLDAGTTQQPGGTGTVFDWQKAVPVVEYMRRTLRIVVAGGLAPANVAQAMCLLKPWGVDVSTGVEARPGKKDPEKVRAFVAAVRREDAKH